MKKIIFTLLFIFAFFIMGYNFLTDNTGIPFINNNENKYKESYNNEINIKIAREIATLNGVEKVAVVKNGETVYIGIAVGATIGGRNDIKKMADSVAREYYEGAEIRVEIENKSAEKIFSISEKAEEGASDEMLIGKIEEMQK